MPFAVSMVSQTVTGVTTSEAVVATIEPQGYNPANSDNIGLRGTLYFTGNASASTVTVRVRQGSGTGGTVVFMSPAITVAAAAVVAISYDCLDSTPGSTTQYTVTMTASAAPGNSGNVTGTLLAFPIS